MSLWTLLIVGFFVFIWLGEVYRKENRMVALAGLFAVLLDEVAELLNVLLGPGWTARGGDLPLTLGQPAEIPLLFAVGAVTYCRLAALFRERGLLGQKPEVVLAAFGGLAGVGGEAALVALGWMAWIPPWNPAALFGLYFGSLLVIARFFRSQRPQVWLGVALAATLILLVAALLAAPVGNLRGEDVLAQIARTAGRTS